MRGTGTPPLPAAPIATSSRCNTVICSGGNTRNAYCRSPRSRRQTVVANPPVARSTRANLPRSSTSPFSHCAPTYLTLVQLSGWLPRGALFRPPGRALLWVGVVGVAAAVRLHQTVLAQRVNRGYWYWLLDR